MFEYPEALLMSTSLFAYLFACVYNHFTYPPEQRKCIPWWRGLKCGAAVCTSNLAYNHAIVLTNFPVVMMVRSCGVLSVVLVGVLFTGVKDTRLKLGSRKILIAAVATVGMIIFKVFDPNVKPNSHHTELLGILLLMLSLLADGFLPDFQAVIKSEYRPHPAVLMGEVNKWAFLLTIGFSVVSGNFLNMVGFIADHRKLLQDLGMIAVLATAGQMFIYRIVREFRQHMVPFIITTRKIFTVAISILTYGHQISPMQMVGLALVLGISTYEFFSESQRPPVALPPKDHTATTKDKDKEQ